MDSSFRLLSRDFVLICLANFLYFGSFYLLMPTLPQYVAVLGGSPGQIGFVIGVFTLASVLIRPLLGRLADRRGRKVLMLLGTAFFALLFALYSTVQDVTLLYLVRLAHGLAHGSYSVASTAYIADLAPPERRGEVIGIYGTSSVLAMAAFPTWGIALVSVGFGTLFLVAFVIAATAFLSVALLTEKKVPARPLPLPLWRVGQRRGVIVPSLTLFAGATVYGATITFLPVYAPQQGLSEFGVFFAVYAASTFASRIIVGRLSDRIGRRKVMLPFMLLLAGATFALIFLDSMPMLITSAICFGFGFGAFMPNLNAFVVDETPPAERGSALGFFTSFMDIGITVGAMGLGLVGDMYGFATMFGVGTAVVIGGLILFMTASSPDVRSQSQTN